MVFRSLFAGVLAAGVMIVGDASAQVLFCPEPPGLSDDKADMQIEAAKLLERLSIALDLHGQPGLDQAAILEAHRDTPGALLAKLGNVADRCTLATTDELTWFHQQLPSLRRAFFEATSITGEAGLQQGSLEGQTEKLDVKIADGLLKDTASLEQSIGLSVRELWRKLWFRPATADDQEDRWAVIVGSPADADEGWALLAEHQKRWTDVYFQLHQPYYDDNRHHAIVVGRKLSQGEAERLLAYAKELGMADDAYIWPVPADEPVSAGAAERKVATSEGELVRKSLDLSILKN